MIQRNAPRPRATGPLAGEPGQRDGQRRQPSARRRAATWLAWWVLMMSLWVAIDDSLQFDELLAGAAAAALAALAAETVSYRAAVRLRMRAAWLAEAARLPGRVAHDTVTVFAALARMLATRQPPPGGFRDMEVRYGDDKPLGVTRRMLLTGARSLAPNTIVLGVDAERDVMVVHELVMRE